MKFLLVEKQEGGCDYTIGCGIRTSVIEADDRHGAIAIAFGKDDDGLWRMSLDGEFSIDTATMYEIKDEIPLSLEAERLRRLIAARDEKQSRDLAAKRLQLAKLKAELGE